MEAGEVVAALGSDAERGLSEKEAEERLERFGRNALERKRRRSIVSMVVDQFKDPLVLLLFGAALISFFVGETVDAALIVAILLVNGAIGFVQEYKAEDALEKLRSMLKPTARVVRDGEVKIIDAELLVPGDIILLEEGDRVPADARLLESRDLMVDESLLTGESVPVEKDAAWVGDAGVADRKNVVYLGTTVVRGRGKAVVYATGKETEMGRIAESLGEIKEEKTVFEEEMEKLSSLIGKITLGVALTVVVVYVLRGLDLLEAVSVGIALAVAAVPEGLPVVITLALSLGVLQMARKNALVRRLKSVEVLGSVDAICTDKTGTITQNRMKVVEWWGDEEWLKVVASCCNNADLRSGTGDPMELALKEFAGDVECKRLSEIPFSSERKMMTVVVELHGKRYILTKGAPEVIGELVGEPFLERAEEMAERGLRVIALAYKEDDGRPEEPTYRLAGVVGLLDPPRKEVIEALRVAKEAGIRTIMITGDHRKTALAVARMVGIEGRVITGKELEEMSDEELEEVIEEVGVFARVDPHHKLRIVRALQRRGHVVAMTGDGVNDAPALKAADVGIALGSGTDVAKEVSDIVLLDNNYAAIVEAVKEGRRIFDNIKKFVMYLLSANTGEVVAVFSASLLGKLLLKPAHLLLLNIVTDGAPAVALALDPPEEDVMKRPPRRRGEPLFSGKELSLGIGLMGLLIGAGILGAFLAGEEGGMEAAWGSVLVGFVLLEFTRLQTVRKEPVWTNRFLVFSVLLSFLVVGVLFLPPLSGVFSVAPPTWTDLLEILLIALVVYLLAKLIKV